MTGPDMRIAADRFYDGTHLYDIRLVSSMGYSASQIDDVRDVEGVGAVMPAKSTDVMGQINEEQYAMRISSLPLSSLAQSTCEDGATVASDNADYLNRLILAEGRWPTKAGECVISADRVAGVPVKMGDTLDVLYGPQDLDGVLATRQFTIVGTAHASSFVSSITMGATSLGSGSIQQFAYVSEDDFDSDYPYTEFFIEVEGASALFSGSPAYQEHVDVLTQRLETLSPRLAQVRYADVVRQAQDELDDARREYTEERHDALLKLDEARLELQDAQHELDDGRVQIEDAEKEIADGQDALEAGQEEVDAGNAELDKQWDSTTDKLEDAYKELVANQKKLDAAQAELDSKRQEAEAWPTTRMQLQSQLKQAQDGLTQAQNGAASAQAAVSQLEVLVAQASALPADDPQRLQLEAQLAQAQSGLKEAQSTVDSLTATISQIEAGIAEGDAGLAAFREGEAQLAAGKKELSAGWESYRKESASANEQLSKAQDTLNDSQLELNDSNTELAQAQEDLDQAKQNLADGTKEFEEGLSEYADERNKAFSELRQAARDIDQAQKDIEELELPDIYVLDRTKNYGVESQVADSERIDNIAVVFPFIFFLVAALVALTTMTRMVEEERGLIGTFKALGYSKGRITIRYVVYAGIASIIGAAIGLAILSQVLPYTIAKAYAIIYNIPEYPLPLPFDWGLGLLAGGLGVGITLLSTLAAALATLQETPASLMLPRAPKAGKRILLERIPLLWQRLSFSWKVTFRNLFRYKKRLTMTVIGIAGCTALLLTGWGLHNAIWDIIDKQYGPVVRYNIIVKMDSDAKEEDMLAVSKYMKDEGSTTGVTRVYSANMQIASDAHGTMGVEVVVPNSPSEFTELLTMKRRSTQEPIAFDKNSVVLTEKLARTLDVGLGDSFTLYDQDDIGNAIGSGSRFTVTGIMENYIGNWAYFGQAAYLEATGEYPLARTLYGLCTEDEKARTAFTEGLHDIEGVQTVSYNDETIESYRQMLSSVDMIVVVLVVSAAALAFIVLYNLTNINITERRREIASLKVLGFTRREVFAYIFREIVLLSVFGALFGLVLGTYLESFVCVTAEVDYVMFGRDIHLSSYLMSFVLTLVFTALVMLFTRKKLTEVDMVESLKSVE